MNEESVDIAVSENKEPETLSRGLSRTLLGYLKTVLLTLVVALFLKTFVVEAYRIPSGSMENTLQIGDFLLVNKLAYGFRTPQYVPLTNLRVSSFTLSLFTSVHRGDVIVFEYPGNQVIPGEEQVNYVKRCIGLPRDTVRLSHAIVEVNGHAMTLPPHAKAREEYNSWHWGARMVPGDKGYTEDDFGPVIVPFRGQHIVLNEQTYDEWKAFIAREGHSIVLDELGRVYLDGHVSTGYDVEHDYYFVLGDNRHNSLDSRFWGFVPDHNLIGEAFMVYWSWDPDLTVTDLKDKFRSIRWERIGMLVR